MAYLTSNFLYMRSLFIMAFTVFLFSFCSYAQQPNADLDLIAGKLITELRSKKIEKILLQTDKPVYNAGETIWFKVLAVDSMNNRLTNRSKILFIDIVDEKDSVTSRLILNAGKYLTNGAFLLSDTIHTGNYWLRAYSQKILDAGLEHISILPLYVINPSKNAAQQNNPTNINKLQSSKSSMNVDVYPEGGSLISGYPSTVAINLSNIPSQLPVTGIVKDHRDTIVARFSTNNNGLAKFNFMPRRLSKYSVYVFRNNKYDSVATLPKINMYAAQLSVAEQNEQIIKVRVLLEDSLFKPDYTTYLLGTNKDSLCFAGVGKGNYELNIPVAAFPGGIATLVLFNAKKQPVSERSVYINKENAKVSIKTDKPNYQGRENVKLEV